MHTTPCMHNAGVSDDLIKTRRPIRCPRCGFEFNLMYARASACQGCRYSVTGCDAVRCPRCDHEFKLNGTGLTADRTASKTLTDYMSKIMNDYFKDFGESPSR